MTLMLNIGKWGGFYCRGGRICLGWIAFTFLPFDVDKLLSKLIEDVKYG